MRPAAIVRFTSLFEVDPVSLVSARRALCQDPFCCLAVQWPEELVLLRDQVVNLIEAAGKVSGASPEFDDWDRQELAELLDTAHRAADSAERIVSRAHGGLSSIILGSAEYFGAMPEGALRNFARLVVLTAGLEIAYVVSRVHADDKLLQQWHPYLQTNRYGERLKYLFECPEPVWATRLNRVGNLSLRMSQYFYGPKSKVQAFLKASGRGLIADHWYEDWIIPQMELMRLQAGDVREVIYDERAESDLKVVDENFDEVNPF